MNLLRTAKATACMITLRKVLATACVSPLRTAKTAACFSLLSTPKPYDSQVAILPNAAIMRDDKHFRLTMCNVTTTTRDAFTSGYHNWTNMWTGAVLPTKANSHFETWQCCIVGCEAG